VIEFKDPAIQNEYGHLRWQEDALVDELCKVRIRIGEIEDNEERE
jgi:hypothetical protein